MPGSVKQTSIRLRACGVSPEFARVWPSLDLGQCLVTPPVEQQKKLAVQRADPFDEVQPLREMGHRWRAASFAIDTSDPIVGH